LTAVSPRSSALEGERRRGGIHLPLQIGQHLGGLALQEQGRVLDVLLIVGFGNQSDARAGAALDLMQHARARAIGEHAVLAGAKLEHLLQNAHAFAHRARAGKGPEVTMRLVELAAVEAELRERFAGQANERIALVVAENDVVARLVRLDQIVLEQQRFAFGTRDRHFDARDLGDHRFGAWMVLSLLEVIGDAFFQVARLPDV
jgi:hypothetical protein